MKKTIPIFLLLLINQSLYSESNFTISCEKDSLISAASLTLLGSSLIIEPVIKEQQNQVPFPDRNLMFSYDESLDNISSYLAYSLLILPGISIIDRLGEKETLTCYALMYLESFVAVTGMKDTLKNLVSRWRPYTYSSNPDEEDNDYYNSFPSGHSSYAFMSAAFLATTLINDNRLEFKSPLIIGSYLAAATTASLRILSGEHFLTDVFAGAALGSIIGWGIPKLHLQTKNENSPEFSISANSIFFRFRI